MFCNADFQEDGEGVAHALVMKKRPEILMILLITGTITTQMSNESFSDSQTINIYFLRVLLKWLISMVPCHVSDPASLPSIIL